MKKCPRILLGGIMSIRGIKSIIGDADILIALISEEDELHDRAKSISNTLSKKKVAIIFPNTAVVEAITSFQRKLSKPKHAAYLKDQYLKGILTVEFVDKQVLDKAAEIFNPYGSKKNTLFDAIVAATAQKLNADALFSFDSWYTKMGFKLVKDLI